MSCGTATGKVAALTAQKNNKNNLKSDMSFHVGSENFLILQPS